MTATRLPDARRGPAPARPEAPRPGAGSPTGWVAVGTSALGVGLLVARAWSLVPPPCVLREHVGVPCPACGTTRLAVALVHGRLGSALAADLPGVVLLVTVALVAVAQLAAWRGRSVPWLRHRALPVLLVGLLGAHWLVTALGGGLP